MKNHVPHTPFSTPLSGSARETELRIRNIMSGPPGVLPLSLLRQPGVLSGEGGSGSGSPRAARRQLCSAGTGEYPEFGSRFKSEWYSRGNTGGKRVWLGRDPFL